MYNEKYLKETRRALRRNQTESERRLWMFLRHRRFHGMKFFRQYSIGPYILDFYCPRLRLAIEIDGSHHNEDPVMKRNIERTAFLSALGIRVVRFSNSEVIDEMERVLFSLVEAVDDMRTPPASPSMKGRSSALNR